MTGTWNVPVTLTVDAETADEAKQLVRDALEGAGVTFGPDVVEDPRDPDWTEAEWVEFWKGEPK